MKLNAKFDADLLLYSLNHFECDSHTVHMLTQWCLPPPLASTVKLSLFTHVHSSPLSLAARLCQCQVLTALIVLTIAGFFSGQNLYYVVHFLIFSYIVMSKMGILHLFILSRSDIILLLFCFGGGGSVLLRFCVFVCQPFI